MEIMFYILLLSICEIFVYSLIIIGDNYLKTKNCKVIKRSKLMLKAKYGNAQEVSKIFYWFQIFNYIYILAFLSIAVIVTFFYKNLLLFNIHRYSLIVYSGLSIILLFVFSFLSPIRDLK